MIWLLIYIHSNVLMTVQDHAMLSAGKGAWDLGLYVIHLVFRVLTFRRGHSAINC